MCFHRSDISPTDCGVLMLSHPSFWQVFVNGIYISGIIYVKKTHYRDYPAVCVHCDFIFFTLHSKRKIINHSESCEIITLIFPEKAVDVLTFDWLASRCACPHCGRPVQLSRQAPHPLYWGPSAPRCSYMNHEIQTPVHQTRCFGNHQQSSVPLWVPGGNLELL